MLFYTINSKESGCANIGPFGSCIRIGAFAGVDNEELEGAFSSNLERGGTWTNA